MDIAEVGKHDAMKNKYKWSGSSCNLPVADTEQDSAMKVYVIEDKGADGKEEFGSGMVSMQDLKEVYDKPDASLMELKKSFPVQLNNGHEVFIRLKFVTKIAETEEVKKEKAGGIALNK